MSLRMWVKWICISLVSLGELEMHHSRIGKDFANGIYLVATTSLTPKPQALRFPCINRKQLGTPWADS